jgi:hypothetical protein
MRRDEYSLNWAFRYNTYYKISVVPANAGKHTIVIPGHRAAMNPESRDDVARDSGFALTRAPE